MPGAQSPSPEPALAAAMVLAAGYGTRLRPLTDERPKPLVPIGDRPLIHHLAERLRDAGIVRLVVNSHHHADAFRGAEIDALPLQPVVLHEPEILGTAGGVHNACEALGPGDVLVWNGDILADVDIAALGRIHAQQQAAATLAVCEAAEQPGTIGLDAEGKVVRLRAERYGVEVRSADFVGIQVLAAGLRAKLPPQGCLVADLYQPALREGARVIAASVVRRWQDVGTPAAYLEANLRWLDDQGQGSFIGPGARLDALVSVDRSVVGRGAAVSGSGLLRRVVAWPGAHVQAPLEGAIVTTAGRIVRV